MLYAMGADQSVDLGDDIKLVVGGSDGADGEDGAGEDGAGEDGADGEDGAEDEAQEIEAKVGDTVTLQLDEPIDGENLTWELIEIHLGYNKIYSLKEESFVVGEEGDKGLRSFKLSVDSDGEETITIVRGDMTKFDDASEDYDDSEEHLWNLDLMKGAEYTQVKLVASA